MWLKLLLGDVETDPEDIGDCGAMKLKASKGEVLDSTSSPDASAPRLVGASSKANKLDGRRAFAVGLIGVPLM
jgi:hypothetical protein